MKKKLTYKYIEEYLREVQSKGRYALSLGELNSRFDASEKAILQNIYRLKRKNQLAQVRKEFYVIVPPQYSARGMVPPTLFIDDMMEFLDREYYVGLYSAAALHGAGHQQPMEFQVITKKSALRSIKNKKLKISFYTKSDWVKEHIMEKKTETGYMKISSPELTAFDLVKYHKRIGGLNRILPILEELAETIKTNQLTKIAKTQKTPCIQRLGFLLDGLGDESLSNSLLKLIGDKPKEVPISLMHKSRTGALNKKWNIIKNSEIDF